MLGWILEQKINSESTFFQGCGDDPHQAPWHSRLERALPPWHDSSKAYSGSQSHKHRDRASRRYQHRPMSPRSPTFRKARQVLGSPTDWQSEIFPNSCTAAPLWLVRRRRDLAGHPCHNPQQPHPRRLHGRNGVVRASLLPGRRRAAGIITSSYICC